MNAINYDSEMRKIMAEAQGKKLLLHSCCAPCSSYCLQTLNGTFQISVLYYNPNLDGEEEYRRRKAEQIRLLSQTGWAQLFPCEYSPEDFLKVTKGREKDGEGGERCALCFRLRLERTVKIAKEHGFDYFATTLTVSPLKNAELINQIGFELAEKYGVNYLPSDFKKRNGYLQSVSLSKEYGLYRQNYCGCAYSKAEMLAREKKE